MEMKWHPIIDGDLSGIPRDKRLLFSGIDQGELYVDFGYVESRLEKHVIISMWSACRHPEAEARWRMPYAAT